MAARSCTNLLVGVIIMSTVICLTAAFSDDKLAETRETFDKFDTDRNGHITAAEIGATMATIGESVPGYQIRDMIKEVDTNEDGTVEFEEFVQMYHKSSPSKAKFKLADTAEKVKKLESGGGGLPGDTEQTGDYSEQERIAFADWINFQLKDDADLSHVLPISTDGSALFEALKDGIVFCKLINKAIPNTVDERAINKRPLDSFTMNENQILALNSATSIGANIVNIGPGDLMEGKPHLVLGLLWQIIRIGLFERITLQNNPNLVSLLNEGEELDDIMKLSPEEILLRWVNYHLQNAGIARRINNFKSDIKDSEVFTYLLKQIAPPDAGVDLSPMEEMDLEKRAEKMLRQADKIGGKKFVQPKDVVKGNSKLNLAFVANLCNAYPALAEVPPESRPEIIDHADETREERTFRNWMNSLGVNPYVTNLYSDLKDGTILLQVFDKIKPGIVDWDKVNQPPFKQMGGSMKKLENCNYVIELGHTLRFSLVGIGGSDINTGNKTLTLALVWQMMRAYVLAILQKLAGSDAPINDAEIVAWTNEKLTAAGKASSITSFKDPSISTSLAVIDLTDAIKPGSVKYELVTDGITEDERISNARYAVSIARKIGARILAKAEDIVEVKAKMMLTVFAALMSRGVQTTPITRDMNLLRELLLLELLENKFD